MGLGKKSRGPHKGAEHTSQRKQAGLREGTTVGVRKGSGWVGGHCQDSVRLREKCGMTPVIPGTLRGRCHCPHFKDGAHR